ncbi:MAG: hypothetical protein FJW69_03315 [Actinobacteria bacterium]|nr:hypothetical protein [Actinomycetota bacterium]MBM3712073.1 hypothetical protein [Actinomycetota bacterium]
MSTLKQIKALEEKRAAALSKILSAKLMAPGSYGRVYCRCGRPNCWCSSGKGHPYSRIVFSEGGRPKTKSINEDNVGWIKKVNKNYRDFKEGIKKIKEYDSILFNLLGKYLKEIIMQTRDKKEYN